MLYGGGKEERRRQNSKDSFERSIEDDQWSNNENKDSSNYFKRRSFSMQNCKAKKNQSQNQRGQSKDKSRQQ